MTTDSTCPSSICVFRNSLGYCTLTDGCILTNKTVEVPTKKEVTQLEKTITPDIVREEFMGCVRDLLLWETPDGESGHESMMRSLFYLQGAYDLANELIARLEGRK